MKKDNKKKKSCVPLDEHQSALLARLIIVPDRTECTTRCEQDRTDYGSKRGSNSF
ncbi:hypothetical protein NXV13_19675 [Bacteroides ovatus]|nr:hypothetical protein [Bacteroides ovatus]